MKIYRQGDSFIAPRGSYFDGNVRVPGNFIVPPETHIWGRLDVNGTLELGPMSTVGGDVTCERAVIGNKVRIKGTLDVIEDVVLCDDVKVAAVRAGGDITLRPGVKVGEVSSDETIYVVGKIESGRLTGRNVKVLGNGH